MNGLNMNMSNVNMMVCAEIAVTGASDEKPCLNTGTFCCRRCGVFDLNGYRNRLTPQLGGISEEEAILSEDDFDSAEEDAILGVLRKAPVVECFNCATLSDAEAAMEHVKEQQAALVMLGELQQGIVAEEGDEMELDDSPVGSESETATYPFFEELLTGFYSDEDEDEEDVLENETDLEKEIRKLSSKSKLGELGELELEEETTVAVCAEQADSLCDAESIIESLKDLMSEGDDDDDVEGAERRAASSGKTLFDFDDEEVEEHTPTRDFASLESASIESCSPKIELSKSAVHIRLSSFNVDEVGAGAEGQLMSRKTVEEINTNSDAATKDNKDMLCPSPSTASTCIGSDSGSFASDCSNDNQFLCEGSSSGKHFGDVGYLRISGEHVHFAHSPIYHSYQALH